MKNKIQNAHFDFIEFPTKSLDDLLKTKSFYSSVFEWIYKDWGDDYSDTKDSGVGSGLNADPSHKSAHPLAVIYIEAIEESKKAVLLQAGELHEIYFYFLEAGAFILPIQQETNLLFGLINRIKHNYNSQNKNGYHISAITIS